MKNVIGALSTEAKVELGKFSECNVGVLRNILPPHVKSLRVYDISLYEKGTKFPDVVYGVSIAKYNESQPWPVQTYSVLVHGDSDDSGCLLGFLKKYGADSGYLYKPYDRLDFKEFDTIKYDYSKYIVKLVEPYSFRKGGGRRF